ncbi:hypothetical protein DMJ13_08645 [halophilic archaeon]|nr:hypothetical protein DMJ13_08645 [halophilic archaeon]
MNGQTRRDFLLATGASVAATLGVMSTGTSAPTESSTDWNAVESPTTKTLNDVVDTVDGPVAVGDGGDVVTRRENGWQKVVEYGPQARSRPLTGVDVTDDGERIWFVGGSGVIGEYDVTTETLTNYSAPKDKTSTWEDVAVRGRAGENERLYFVNGSGELLIGVREDSGALRYADVLKPGGGSTIPGIEFYSRWGGHVCSTSQLVSKSTTGGTEWEQIGIGFSGESFFDVASVGPRDANVAAGAGIIYRYDGFRWTPHVVDHGRQAIRAIDRDGDAGLAAGAGGKVYERQSTGQWRRYSTGSDTKFRGVSHGSDGVDVAVGNNGAIVERTGDASDGTTTTTTTTTESSNATTTTTTTTTTDTTATTASSDTASAARVSVPDASETVSEYVEGEWV